MSHSVCQYTDFVNLSEHGHIELNKNLLKFRGQNLQQLMQRVADLAMNIIFFLPNSLKTIHEIDTLQVRAFLLKNMKIPQIKVLKKSKLQWTISHKIGI